MKLASLYAAGRRDLRSVVALTAGALLPGSCAAAPATGPVRHEGRSDPGAQLWVKRYNGPANGADEASSVAVSPDASRVFVTGRGADSSHEADYATIAYNAATGARLWMSRYNDPGNGFDYAIKVVVSPDSRTVYVTGSIYVGPGRDYATIAYDAATGARLWVSTYGGSAVNGPSAPPAFRGPPTGGTSPDAMVISQDGKTLFVTGKAVIAEINPYGDNRYGFGTVAYDATTGARLWASRYAPANSSAGADAIGLSPDGKGLFVAGSSSDGQADTVRYDTATGTRLWVRPGGPVQGWANSLAVSPSGDAVFVAHTAPSARGRFTGCCQIATVAYDAATGARLWQTSGPAGVASSVAVSPDSTGTRRLTRVFVAGFTAHACITVADEPATGTRLWASRYQAAAHSRQPTGAMAIAVSPDGSHVYVTGQSAGAISQLDSTTVAYAASSGAQLWVRHYNGPGNATDSGSAIAVSATGHTVFVTGFSTGKSSGYDYVTVALPGLTKTCANQ